MESAPDYQEYEEYLSEQRRDKIARFVREQSKAESAGAELLLIHALRDNGIREDTPIMFEYGKNGKPSLRSHACHFSLSHSGGVCAAVLSDEPIGLDLQFASDSAMRAASRVFGEAELAEFMQASDKPDFFFTHWTAKESYIKLLGLDLSSINKIGITGGEGCYTAAKDGKNTAHCRVYKSGGRYIAVSSKSDREYRIKNVGALFEF